jgi:hypothetical protein
MLGSAADAGMRPCRADPVRRGQRGTSARWPQTLLPDLLTTASDHPGRIWNEKPRELGRRGLLDSHGRLSSSSTSPNLRTKPGIQKGVPPSRPPLVSRPLPLSPGGAARDWTDCQLLQPYAGKVRQQPW